MSENLKSAVRVELTSSRHTWDNNLSDPLIFVNWHKGRLMLDIGPGVAYMTSDAARELAAKLNCAANNMEGRERTAESSPAAGHTIESAEVCEVNGTAWVPEDKIAVTVLVPASYAPHIGLGTNTTLTIHPQDGGQA